MNVVSLFSLFVSYCPFPFYPRKYSAASGPTAVFPVLIFGRMGQFLSARHVMFSEFRIMAD